MCADSNAECSGPLVRVCFDLPSGQVTMMKCWNHSHGPIFYAGKDLHPYVHVEDYHSQLHNH